MGASFEAECKSCGYRGYGLVGGGWQDVADFLAWPCQCLSCAAVTTANVAADPVVCLACGSQEVTLYDDKVVSIEGSREAYSTDVVWGDRRLDASRKYQCPSCRNVSLRIREGTVLWD